jgi:ABC-type polysaccharide/polyol phosphate export permease
MFQPEQLSQRGISVLRWSPFASLLEVLSAPILGSRPSDLALIMCATMAAVGFLLLLPFAGRYAPRAVYWL